MRKVLLLLSDTHGGSDVGLCNPETKLFDKNSRKGWSYPSLTDTQSMLWERFDLHLKEAKQFAGSDPIIVVHLGDISHGGVFLTDVIEPRFIGQYQISKYNMYYMFDQLGDQLESLLIIEGTGVHTYDGSIEYVVADLLREKYERDIWCYPHMLLKIGKTTHDLAHHGPSPGKRVWTKGSSALGWLKSMMIRDIMGGKRPNSVTYRGHFHEWVPVITNREVAIRDTGITQYESHFVFVPGYSGLSDHSRKATQSESIVSLGMVAVEIIDGRLIGFYPIVSYHDTRVREEIDCGL